MKKQSMLVFIGVFILILAACGQGSGSTEPEENANGIVSEENSDLVESEDPAESVDDNANAPEDASEDDINASTDNSSENGSATTAEGVDENTTTPVELLFADDQVMDMFRVERQIEANDEELFVATLEAWVDGPIEEGLVSLIPTNVEVQSVEEIDGVAHVSFSAELLDAQVGSGVEAMLLQQVAVMMKQFGFSETQILIDGEVHPELFGHMDTSEPIVADDPEDYEKVE